MLVACELLHSIAVDICAVCIIVLVVSAGLMVSWQDTSRGRNTLIVTRVMTNIGNTHTASHRHTGGASSDQDTSQLSVDAMGRR